MSFVFYDFTANQQNTAGFLLIPLPEENDTCITMETQRIETSEDTQRESK